MCKNVDWDPANPVDQKKKIDHVIADLCKSMQHNVSKPIFDRNALLLVNELDVCLIMTNDEFKLEIFFFFGRVKSRKKLSLLS